MPDSIQACTGKLVSKAAYEALNQQKVVKADHPDIPLGVIQQQYSFERLSLKDWDWEWKAMLARAKAGDLAAVQWLWEQECPFDRTIFTVTAGAGHLEVLKWLHNQHDM